MDLAALPASELIREGLEDLRVGRESVTALLVEIGAPRLRQIGIDVPPSGVLDPEHRLYELLAADDADSAHEPAKTTGVD